MRERERERERQRDHNILGNSAPRPPGCLWEASGSFREAPGSPRRQFDRCEKGLWPLAEGRTFAELLQYCTVCRVGDVFSHKPTVHPMCVPRVPHPPCAASSVPVATLSPPLPPPSPYPPTPYDFFACAPPDLPTTIS